jgi:replicative DNA helicase
MDALPPPPHSIIAEQAVLGGLMLNNETWDIVCEILSANDFYRTEHRFIFKAIARLRELNEPFDPISIFDKLEGAKVSERAGGLDYIGKLLLSTPTAANIKYYAQIVRNRSIDRQVINVSSEIAQMVYNRESEGQDLIDRVVSTLSKVDNKNNFGGQGISHFLAKAVDRIDQLFNSDSKYTGIPTGFDDLDDLTSGLQQSDLIIIAGRPAMGKTSLAMNIVENVMENTDAPVLVFSMEMSGEQLAMRMIASLARMNLQKVRAGKISEEDWPKITQAIKKLSDKNLLINDSAGLTPSQIASFSRKSLREYGQLGLIVVDYLQLMAIPDSKENRTNEISEISRSLKILAKELNVPVVALSQLNRGLEQRQNKRPAMSDLRDSGAIEQDADMVIFVYRDEVYNDKSEDKGTAEIIISKQRNGPIGMVRLAWLGEYTRFENLSRGYDSEVSF